METLSLSNTKTSTVVSKEFVAFEVVEKKSRSVNDSLEVIKGIKDKKISEIETLLKLNKIPHLEPVVYLGLKEVYDSLPNLKMFRTKEDIEAYKELKGNEFYRKIAFKIKKGAFLTHSI